ncbi:MAG: hypothetical protein V4582_11605 [Pseudomonadota bacterium]
MKISTPIMIAASLLCASAGAAELATAVRPTELKAKPFSDAPTLANLEKENRVEVLNRQTSWIQVKSNANTGWVKMLSLKFDQLAGAPAKGDEGLRSLYSVVSGGTSASTGGVRGLDEEKILNPHPNPVALREMNSRVVGAAETTAFAKAGKLETNSMAYVKAGTKK